jgi:hypothetical protein
VISDRPVQVSVTMTRLPDPHPHPGCPVAAKIPWLMSFTCEEESSLTTRDDNSTRFAGFRDGQAVIRDNEDCSTRGLA